MNLADPAALTVGLLLALSPMAARWLGPRREVLAHPALGSWPALRDRWRAVERAAGAVRWLALLLLALAIGRPLRGVSTERREVPGIELVLLLDRSSSMALRDRPGASTRFEAARQALREFLAGRDRDRIALLGFARYPELLCPRTVDRELMGEILAEVQPVAPRSAEDGTALGSALVAAARALERSAVQSRVAILLTDGENNVEDIRPEEAAALCRQRGIRLYTVGMGRGFEARAPGPAASSFALLEKLAGMTGGRAYVAAGEAELHEIYRRIDVLERSSLEVSVRHSQRELCGGLALAAALLMAVVAVAESTALRRVP